MASVYDPAINQFALWKELESIHRFVAMRHAHFNANDQEEVADTLDELIFEDEASLYHDYIRDYHLTHEQRFTLGLLLAAYLTPDRLKQTISQTGNSRIKQTCILIAASGNYFPTATTVALLLQLNDVRYVEKLARVFEFSDLHTKPLFYVSESNMTDSFFAQQIHVSPTLLDLLIFGAPRPPAFSPTFPARLCTTALHWDDLVLTQNTRNQLLDTLRWLTHGPAVVEQMQGRLKPGLKTLFYGPPGTGKSLAAALLGKKSGREVYRIDLSQIVSKYIGETEKNFAEIFNHAHDQNWILFFDEADALFGKRTETRDAHDKYANQETSYLLMRLEDHAGPVILATNFKDNIDPAFSRRFTQIIYFPQPQADERLLLWKSAIPANTRTDASLNYEELARKYEISGAQIVNAAAWCLLRLTDDPTRLLDHELVRAGVAREVAKEGRTL
jgi:hypothetical protein